MVVHLGRWGALAEGTTPIDIALQIGYSVQGPELNDGHPALFTQSESAIGVLMSGAPYPCHRRSSSPLLVVICSLVHHAARLFVFFFFRLGLHFTNICLSCS